MQLSKKELVEDNEELICLLNDVLVCCEEQGMVLPEDLEERISEFLIMDDTEGDVDNVIDIKPVK